MALVSNSESRANAYTTHEEAADRTHHDPETTQADDRTNEEDDVYEDKTFKAVHDLPGGL